MADIIKLKSDKSKHIRTTRKNKKGEKAQTRIKLKKFDPIAGEHATYTESK